MLRISLLFPVIMEPLPILEPYGYLMLFPYCGIGL